MNFRFLSIDEEELSASAVFYEEQSIGLGSEFLDDIQKTINRILSQPGSGYSYDENLRMIILSRFPYSIIYTQEEGYVLTVAIAHQRRRPGFWRDRAPND